MEALLVVLALAFVLGLPAGVIITLVQNARLRRRLDALEARIATPPKVQDTPPPATTTAPVAPVEAVDPVAPPRPDASAPPETPATPWTTRTPPQPTEPQPPAPPSALSQTAARFAAWLQQNWFYAIAAVSLALAGLFLVQYGVEKGLLSPPLRVASALAFGLALIAGGERIRRRSGDTEDTATAYLPSTLSSAGLVTLMGGILAARQLYDLIAPTPALIALFATALGGLLLGWLNGPLLAAIGVLGGMAAPFLVGGSSDAPEWLLLYFALLTALGLGIDTLRRWAWVSVLSLVAGVLAGALLWYTTGSEVMHMAFGAYAAALALMAILIPARSLTPDQQGICLTQALRAGTPSFPTLLAAGATLAASLILIVAADRSPTTWWTALILATALAALLSYWSKHAPGLQDLAALPALAVLFLLVSPELTWPLLDALRAQLAETATQTEQRLPLQVTMAMLAPLTLTLAAAHRSLRGAPFAAHWAAAAALMAPLGGLALELTWHPTELIGTWPWALHALAVAALMTGLAARFARVDGADKLRSALATISALACLAFALSVILTEAALTLALAATVLAAAALDRRFDLAPLGGYIVAGVLALGYRLVADPGLDWATSAPFIEAFAAYAGTLAALLAAWHLLKPMDRPRERVFLESACWSVGALTVSVLLDHLIDALTGGTASGTEHWQLGLYAATWAAVALAQLDRLRLHSRLKWLRIGLAALFGLVALALMGLGLLVANPLDAIFDTQHIAGPVLLNTLAPAYLLPALVLLAALWRWERDGHLPRLLRRALGAVALALTAFWAGLVIRHAWQGGDAMEMRHGITQPELYSYTVALLFLGAALFLRALQTGRDGFRRAGIGVIALAIAKVFLIDASGLDGLARVFSFLLLGLSLAGLAWLNRWVQMRRTLDPD